MYNFDEIQITISDGTQKYFYNNNNDDSDDSDNSDNSDDSSDNSSDHDNNDYIIDLTNIMYPNYNKAFNIHTVLPYKIVPNCCDMLFCCWECHDNHFKNKAYNHRVNRTNITKIVCCSCNKYQAFSDRCNACNISFNSCTVCKDVKGFHCSKCDICIHDAVFKTHLCNSNQQCLICLEDLKLYPVVSLKCDHIIHRSCYRELTKYSCKCPVCCKNMEVLT